ncbi:MAG: four helix bundle protein [Ferruginibacter sp.]|nr:four helix bundle protein [Ferruginibacter sp.]MBU9936444.1 four helix bundle protein [Ferruginibacter sp.]
MGLHNFRELRIWQRSVDLAEMIYKTTSVFPAEEKYGLISQLRRCAVSVPSNISEGAGRATNKQFKYFLEISMGSCNELQTQLELSFRFNFITKEILDKLNDEILQIYKMILVFYNSLKSE